MKAISRDHGAELILNKQARFRAQELIKHQQMIVEKGKAIRGLESVTLAYKTVSSRHSLPENVTCCILFLRLQNLVQLMLVQRHN